MAATRQLQLKDSDRVLVRQFARQHDGEAFSILVRRYADMVYTTSWRILRDEALAADAVQETFFQLAQNAGKVTGCLGSWLHRVATRRAVDLIRQNCSRRNREQSYALEADCQTNAWSEVEPAVDEALDELPENLREVLLLHFLQGRSTIQIAADQGLSQPTISRRLAEALEMLREKLRDRGVIAGATPLQAILLNSNQIAPEAVRAVLGKVALAKAASANALWIFGHSAPGAALGIKLALAVAGSALVAGTIWLKRTEGPKPKVATSYAPTVASSGASVAEPAGSQSAGTPLVAVAAIDSSPIPAPSPPSAAPRDPCVSGNNSVRPYTILLPSPGIHPQPTATKSVRVSPPRQSQTAGRNASRESVSSRGIISQSHYEYSRLGCLAVWLPFRPLPIQSSTGGLLAIQNGPRGPRVIELKARLYPGVLVPRGYQRDGTNGISNEKVLVRNSVSVFASARNPSAALVRGGTVGVPRTGQLSGP